MGKLSFSISVRKKLSESQALKGFFLSHAKKKLNEKSKINHRLSVEKFNPLDIYFKVKKRSIAG